MGVPQLCRTNDPINAENEGLTRNNIIPNVILKGNSWLTRRRVACDLPLGCEFLGSTLVGIATSIGDGSEHPPPIQSCFPPGRSPDCLAGSIVSIKPLAKRNWKHWETAFGVELR